MGDPNPMGTDVLINGDLDTACTEGKPCEAIRRRQPSVSPGEASGETTSTNILILCF